MQIPSFPSLLVEKIVFLGVEWSSMGVVLLYLEKRKLGELEFTLHLLDCHSRFSRFVKSIHSSLLFPQGTMRVVGLSGIKVLQGVCQTWACLPRVPVLEVSRLVHASHACPCWKCVQTRACLPHVPVLEVVLSAGVSRSEDI